MGLDQGEKVWPFRFPYRIPKHLVSKIMLLISIKVSYCFYVSTLNGLAPLMPRMIPRWQRYAPLLSDVVAKKQLTNTQSNKRYIFKCTSEFSHSELSYSHGLQLTGEPL